MSMIEKNQRVREGGLWCTVNQGDHRRLHGDDILQEDVKKLRACYVCDGEG